MEMEKAMGDADYGWPLMLIFEYVEFKMLIKPLSGDIK